MSDANNKNQTDSLIRTSTDSVSEADVIYRQDAIEAVKKICWNCSNTICHNLINEVSVLPSAQQWIPCSEQMPEDDMEVMTTVEIISNGKRFVEQGSYFYHGWCLAYDNLRLTSNIRVIAWMPLPEPYTKDGDSE